MREAEVRVEASIGRHPKNRKKMAVVAGGRAAATNFKVAERFPFTNLVECRLETGRTHQIRVHLAHIGHPVFGDPVYGGRDRARGIRPEYQRQAKWMLTQIKRQALHAYALRFAHPTTGEAMAFYGRAAGGHAGGVGCGAGSAPNPSPKLPAAETRRTRI